MIEQNSILTSNENTEYINMSSTTTKRCQCTDNQDTTIYIPECKYEFATCKNLKNSFKHFTDDVPKLPLRRVESQIEINDKDKTEPIYESISQNDPSEMLDLFEKCFCNECLKTKMLKGYNYQLRKNNVELAQLKKYLNRFAICTYLGISTLLILLLMKL